MEMLFAILCFIAYCKTLDGSCLIACGLMMIAWEIWFCFHKEDKNRCYFIEAGSPGEALQIIKDRWDSVNNLGEVEDYE